MTDLALERGRVLDHSKQIVAKVKAAGRDLTDYEQSQLESDMARVKTLDKQLAGRALVSKVRNLGGADDEPDRRTSAFTQEAKDAITNALRTGTSYRTEVSAKALTSNALLPPSGSFVQEGLHPNSQFPLSSLFANEPADGPVQRYYKMTAGTAGLVNEAAAKPDSGIAALGVDLALSKIAALAQVSSEMQMDAAFLVQGVELELQAAILARENQLILDTFAATSGVLTGTGTTATVVDLIADAIAAMEGISGVTPVAIIGNPTVVASIRKSKASTSGVYNVDVLSTAPTTLHGVKVISTPATAAGVAWLVSGPGVTIYRRGGVMVNIGTNADDLAKNLSTIVAEERVGVAVTRPNSLYKLTLT